MGNLFRVVYWVSQRVLFMCGLASAAAKLFGVPEIARYEDYIDVIFIVSVFVVYFKLLREARAKTPLLSAKFVPLGIPAQANGAGTSLYIAVKIANMGGVRSVATECGADIRVRRRLFHGDLMSRPADGLTVSGPYGEYHIDPKQYLDQTSAIESGETRWGVLRIDFDKLRPDEIGDGRATIIFHFKDTWEKTVRVKMKSPRYKKSAPGAISQPD